MVDRVIVVDELRFRYRGAAAWAVDGMSFDVDAGEIFGFLGPNGAGKSTTQRVLTRLLRGHQGRVMVFDKPIETWDKSYFERVGVGFELPAHFSKLTARENLAAFASFCSGPVEEPMDLLALVDLTEAADQPVSSFPRVCKCG